MDTLFTSLTICLLKAILDGGYYWTNFDSDLWEKLSCITECKHSSAKASLIFSGNNEKYCIVAGEETLSEEYYLPPEEFLTLIKLKLL